MALRTTHRFALTHSCRPDTGSLFKNHSMRYETPGLRTHTHAAFAVCRFAFPPTSAQTWRIYWEICCRWTWPSDSATSGMESMISRATSGSPPLIGLRSTRGRWEASPHIAAVCTNIVPHFPFWNCKDKRKVMLTKEDGFNENMVSGSTLSLHLWLRVVSHHLYFLFAYDVL